MDNWTKQCGCCHKIYSFLDIGDFCKCIGTSTYKDITYKWYNCPCGSTLTVKVSPVVYVAVSVGGGKV